LDERTRELIKVRIEKAEEDIETAGELLSLKRYRAVVKSLLCAVHHHNSSIAYKEA